MADAEDSLFARSRCAEKLPETLSVHLTAEQKRLFEMVCSFEGKTPSGALREHVIAEILKWQERFQSMRQVFNDNDYSGSMSSAVGDARQGPAGNGSDAK